MLLKPTEGKEPERGGRWALEWDTWVQIPGLILTGETVCLHLIYKIGILELNCVLRIERFDHYILLDWMLSSLLIGLTPYTQALMQMILCHTWYLFLVFLVVCFPLSRSFPVKVSHNISCLVFSSRSSHHSWWQRSLESSQFCFHSYSKHWAVMVDVSGLTCSINPGYLKRNG